MKNNLKLITYLPFIGWFFPLWKNYEDRFIVNHVKQAMTVAAFTAAGVTLLYIMTVFMPAGIKSVKFAMVIAIYFIYALYLCICIAGTFMISKEKEFEIPLLKKYAHKIDI